MINKAILALISQYLAKQGYQVSEHLRLSQHKHSTDSCHNQKKEGMPSDAYYQGLTRVIPQTLAGLPTSPKTHPTYVFKWHLSPSQSQIKPQATSQYEQQQQSANCTFGLYQEIDNLQRINCQIQNVSYPVSATVPIIAYYSDSILATDTQQHWQGIGFMMPYCAHGSVKDYLLKQHNDIQQSHSSEISCKLDIALAMAHNLRQLHDLGWVHGDIKPSNFLLHSIRTNIRTYLSDLSCAFQLNQGTANTDTLLSDTLLSGTAAYMAPECWQGQPKSKHSDIYAFGIALYEIVMGKRPFVLDSSDSLQDSNNNLDCLQGWAQQHCQQPVPLLSAQLQEQYPALQTIIDKLLAKQVSNRYRCMEAVCSDIRQLLT